jgi:sulfotransferase
MSRMYSEVERETVYSRSRALMTQGHTVRFAYDCLKEAITGPQKHMVMLVEYDQLAKNPERTIRSLYNFIEQPYFQHNFDAVDCSYDEYDLEAGIKGLHKIRKRVEFIKRDSILPPDLFHEFSGLEVWR